MAKSKSGCGGGALFLVLLVAGGAAGLWYYGGMVRQQEAAPAGDAPQAKSEIAPPPDAPEVASDPAPAAPQSAVTPPPAPKPAAAKPELKLSDEQRDYLAIAKKLGLSPDTVKKPPAMAWSSGGLGSIPGRLRLAQIVDGDMAIVETVSGSGAPATFLITPAPYDKADGDEFSLSQAVCKYIGKKKYSTIFGDSAALDAVEVLDGDLIAWARDFEKIAAAGVAADAAKAAAQNQWLTEFSTAHSAMKQVRDQLSQLRGENPKLEQYVRAKGRVEMYERVPNKNERVMAALEKARKDLELLGEVDDAAAEQYKARRTALGRSLRDAARELAQVRKSKPF